MKRFDIIKSLKSNNSRYRSYSALFTVIVLIILVCINLLALKFNLKKDLTKDKLYSITNETKKIINDLKNDIIIYAFFQTGEEDKSIKEVLEKYEAASDKIHIQYVDPLGQPQLVQKYSKDDKNVDIGSIVIESENKFKVIDYMDFYNYTYDETGEQIYDSFAAEQQLTNAITYVSSDIQQVIYNLIGHEEKMLETEVVRQLEAENYVLKDINLLQLNSKLEKNSVLMINSPQRDISKEEVGKIKTFLENGGRAAFFIDISKEPLTQLQELLSFYGITCKNALVIEGNYNMLVNNAYELLPEIKSHEITSIIKSNKLPIFVPISQSIEELKEKREAVKIEPLLSTSNNSWAKVNIYSNKISKEEGDLQGPFNIGVAITDESTKLIIVGGTTFMSSSAIEATSGANLDFVMNSFNWLQDKKDNIKIRPKNLRSDMLLINASQKLFWSGVVIFFIPTIVAILGIIVWLKRRHR